MTETSVGVNSNTVGDTNNVTTPNGSGCTTGDNSRIMDTIVDMDYLGATNTSDTRICSDVIEGIPEVD